MTKTNQASSIIDNPQRTTVFINAETVQKVKIQAIKERSTMTGIVEQALKIYMQIAKLADKRDDGGYYPPTHLFDEMVDAYEYAESMK